MLRQLLLFTLCVLFTLSLSAQMDFTFQADAMPTVEGKLINFKSGVDDSLEIKYVIVVPTPESQMTKRTYPNSDGTFTLEMPFKIRNQQVWFSIGDYYYGELLVDKDLFIEADLEALKKEGVSFWTDNGAIHFSGSDGPMTQIVNERVTYSRSLEERPDAGKMQMLINREMKPEDKVIQLRSIYQKVEEVDAEFMKERPAELAWVIENERLSDFYGELAVIYWGANMPMELKEEIMGHQPKFTSNSSTSYFRYLSMLFNRLTSEERVTVFRETVRPTIEAPEELLKLDRYIANYEKLIAKEDYDKKQFAEDAKYFNQQYKAAIANATHAAFKKDLEGMDPEKAAMMILRGGQEDIWEREAYVKAMLPMVKPKWASEIMANEWAKTRKSIMEVNERLAKIEINAEESSLGNVVGKLDNGAALYSNDSNDLEALLAAIRANNQGKAVILDVWATWCGPCIYDMKEGKENKKKLKDMGVEVVYLCVSEGSDQERWQKKVTELEVTGTHIFLHDDLSKQIMKYFDLRGYPSHVFIDGKGRYQKGLVSSIRSVDLEKVRLQLKE